MIAAGEQRFEADNVVIATGPFQAPYVPDFADQLDPRLTSMHSSEYRNAAQLPDGDVLVVGAGNSGADIALELVAAAARLALRRVRPADPVRHRGNLRATDLPAAVAGLVARPDVRLPGRTQGAAEDPARASEPLIRVKPKQLARRASSSCRGPQACATGFRCSTTGACWTSQRRVEHRLPAGPRLDRPTGARRGLRRRDRPPRRRHVPARPLPSRARVPVCIQLAPGRWRRPRRRANRQANRFVAPRRRPAAAPTRTGAAALGPGLAEASPPGERTQHGQRLLPLDPSLAQRPRH